MNPLTVCTLEIPMDLADRWAEPEMRSILMRSLIDEWAEGALGITGCEEIAGSVQWEQR